MNILEWATALESGKYTQCFDFWEDGDSFCAIGLAGHLIGFSRSALAVSYFFGLTSAEVAKIIEMNDTDKSSFVEIAAYLREIHKNRLKRLREVLHERKTNKDFRKAAYRVAIENGYNNNDGVLDKHGITENDTDILRWYVLTEEQFNTEYILNETI